MNQEPHVISEDTLIRGSFALSKLAVRAALDEVELAMKLALIKARNTYDQILTPGTELHEKAITALYKAGQSLQDQRSAES
jgi:hypothetical protein